MHREDGGEEQGRGGHKTGDHVSYQDVAQDNAQAESCKGARLRIRGTQPGTEGGQGYIYG